MIERGSPSLSKNVNIKNRIMSVKEYFSKFKGGARPFTRVLPVEVFWSFLGSFIGISACGYLSSFYFEPKDMTLFIAPFCASAVLVYGAIKSPLAQPRNLIGGHILSGLMGVLSYQIVGEPLWFAGAMAVSSAIAIMLITKTLHPPGGGTALIAVIGGEKIHKLGFLYPFIPAGLGAVILLIIALFVNNLAKKKKVSRILDIEEY